jgi:hypothetical protein
LSPVRASRDWRYERLAPSAITLIAMPTLTGVVLAAGLLAAAQQRPSFSYEVVVESARTIESTLRDLARDGYTCAAVARPGGGRLSNNVAVIVSQSAAASASSSPSSSSSSSSRRRARGKDEDVMVITATAGTPDALEQRLNAAAQEGFSLCGLTMTDSIWGQPAEYATVAVMTRTGTSPAGTSYRVVRSRARREDWTLLERAAADGFVVSRLVSRPNYVGAANTSDIVFVAEKSASSRPTRYELAFAGNGPALQKEIDKSTKRGYCVRSAWATSERVSVLLAKPLDSACDRPHDYEVEESSRFSVNSADGELLAMFRVKEGVMALYNGRDTSLEYSVIEGVLPDPAWRRIFRPREHRLFTEKLDADGGRGYRVIDVTWRDAGGANDGRSLDVVLSRPRQ